MFWIFFTSTKSVTAYLLFYSNKLEYFLESLKLTFSESKKIRYEVK